MNDTEARLQDLYDRTPRRHNADNVKEIYSILDDYEALLQELEADPQYESAIAPYFDALDPIRASVKKSNDPKASKKGKDDLFDEASGMLKESIEELKGLVGGGA